MLYFADFKMEQLYLSDASCGDDLVEQGLASGLALDGKLKLLVSSGHLHVDRHFYHDA